MYYFFAPYNNRKSFQMSTIRLNRKCSKVVGISSSIFDNVRKSSENRWRSSEVARTFPEIPVMTRQKSYAFHSEKVGRYRMVLFSPISISQLKLRIEGKTEVQGEKVKVYHVCGCNSLLNWSLNF